MPEWILTIIIELLASEALMATIIATIAVLLPATYRGIFVWGANKGRSTAVEVLKNRQALAAELSVLVAEAKVPQIPGETPEQKQAANEARAAIAAEEQAKLDAQLAELEARLLANRDEPKAKSREDALEHLKARGIIKPSSQLGNE